MRVGLLAATNLLFSEARANTKKQLTHRTNIRIHFAFLRTGSLIMTAAFACAMLIPRGCNRLPPSHNVGEAAFTLPRETTSRRSPIWMTKMLFCHLFSITWKGPVYLGARGGLARVSSRTYTYLLSWRLLVRNGDCRNFFASSCGGRYFSVVSLASCSCRIVLLDGVTSWPKHVPSTLRGILHITSAADVAVSDHGALRSPSRTHRSARVQELDAVTVQRSEFLNNW